MGAPMRACPKCNSFLNYKDNDFRYLVCSCGYTLDTRAHWLTLDDLLTSSGKYPDRAKHKECTEEVKKNGEALLFKVNSMLDLLDIKGVKVSSGFRPSDVNGKVGGSKKSNHMAGKAIDLFDLDGKIDEAIAKSGLLERFDLYLESPAHTKNWSHIQTTPTKSRKRIFIP